MQSFSSSCCLQIWLVLLSSLSLKSLVKIPSTIRLFRNALKTPFHSDNKQLVTTCNAYSTQIYFLSTRDLSKTNFFSLLKRTSWETAQKPHSCQAALPVHLLLFLPGQYPGKPRCCDNSLANS